MTSDSKKQAEFCLRNYGVFNLRLVIRFFGGDIKYKVLDFAPNPHELKTFLDYVNSGIINFKPYFQPGKIPLNKFFMFQRASAEELTKMYDVLAADPHFKVHRFTIEEFWKNPNQY